MPLNVYPNTRTQLFPLNPPIVKSVRKWELQDEEQVQPLKTDGQGIPSDYRRENQATLPGCPSGILRETWYRNTQISWRVDSISGLIIISMGEDELPHRSMTATT